MPNFLPVCVFLLTLWLAPSSSVGDDQRSPVGGEFYTNSWAVEVAGGRAVADDVARHHGFVNVGQVREFRILRDPYANMSLSTRPAV